MASKGETPSEDFQWLTTAIEIDKEDRISMRNEEERTDAIGVTEDQTPTTFLPESHTHTSISRFQTPRNIIPDSQP